MQLRTETGRSAASGVLRRWGSPGFRAAVLSPCEGGRVFPCPLTVPPESLRPGSPGSTTQSALGNGAVAAYTPQACGDDGPPPSSVRAWGPRVVSTLPEHTAQGRRPAWHNASVPGAPLVARKPQVPTSSSSCTPLFAKLLLLSHFPPRLLAVSQHPHGTFQPGPQPAPMEPSQTEQPSYPARAIRPSRGLCLLLPRLPTSSVLSPLPALHCPARLCPLRRRPQIFWAVLTFLAP